MIHLQGSAMEASQTKAIDVCSAVHPDPNKEDSRIAELYNPLAAQDFEEMFQKFIDGADLRDEDQED